MPNYLVQQKIDTQHSRAWFLEFPNIYHCLTLEDTSEIPKRHSIILNKREIATQHDRAWFSNYQTSSIVFILEGFFINTSESLKEYSIVLSKWEITTQHDRAWFSNCQTPSIAFILKDF